MREGGGTPEEARSAVLEREASGTGKRRVLAPGALASA